LNEQIIIPKNYEVENPFCTTLEKIPTKDKKGNENGNVIPIVNTLIPETLPIKLVYFTQCKAGCIKGPHMHTPPKWDRFICVQGGCIVVTKNEQTGKISEFMIGEWFANENTMITIPPFNSHAIVSKMGCVVLSICNEGFYPGHYNQIETEYEGYDWSGWIQ